MRRGFDTEQVKTFLELVARQLRAHLEREESLRVRCEDAERRAANPVLDEQTLTSALGQEAAKILRTAHDAAGEVVARSEEQAAAVLAGARDQAAQLQARAEATYGERELQANELAETMRRDAEDEAASIRQRARSDAEAMVATAKEECLAMLHEARELRSKILTDLAQRRRVLHAQVEQLRAGRDVLLEAVREVRRSVDRLGADLRRADADARAAAEQARHRAEASVDQMDPTQSPPIEAPLEPPNQELMPSTPRADPDVHEPWEDGGHAELDEPAIRILSPEEVLQSSQAEAADEGLPGPVQAPTTFFHEATQATPVVPGVSTVLFYEPGADAVPGTSGEPEVDGQPEVDGEPEVDGSSMGPGYPPASGADSVETTGPIDLGELAKEDAPHTKELASGLQVDVDESRQERSVPVSSERVEELFARLRSSQPAPREDQALREDVIGEWPGERPDAGEPYPGRGAELLGSPRDMGEGQRSEDPVSEQLLQRVSQGDLSSQSSSAALSDQLGDSTALLRQRNAMIEGVTADLIRRLKRAFQDDQNELLDRIRSLPGDHLPDAMVEEDSELSRFSEAVRQGVLQAGRAGAAFTGAPGSPDVGDLCEDLARSIVVPLRRRLLESLDVEGVEASEAVGMVGAAYRDWRGERIERLAEDYAIAAFSKGVVNALASGGVVHRWIAASGSGSPCPDCEDNALAGTVAAQGLYPTGHAHPPAHPGCRCLVVPATA